TSLECCLTSCGPKSPGGWSNAVAAVKSPAFAEDFRIDHREKESLLDGINFPGTHMEGQFDPVIARRQRTTGNHTLDSTFARERRNGAVGEGSAQSQHALAKHVIDANA